MSWPGHVQKRIAGREKLFVFGISTPCIAEISSNIPGTHTKKNCPVVLCF